MSHKKIEGASLIEILFIKNGNSPYSEDGGCEPEAHNSLVCVNVLFQTHISNGYHHNVQTVFRYRDGETQHI
jgi:hypothetical protein